MMVQKANIDTKHLPLHLLTGLSHSGLFSYNSVWELGRVANLSFVPLEANSLSFLVIHVARKAGKSCSFRIWSSWGRLKVFISDGEKNHTFRSSCPMSTVSSLIYQVLNYHQMFLQCSQAVLTLIHRGMTSTLHKGVGCSNCSLTYWFNKATKHINQQTAGGFPQGKNNDQRPEMSTSFLLHLLSISRTIMRCLILLLNEGEIKRGPGIVGEYALGK